tara:strand:+ start:2921 stop:3622 length:702 start_codon:yes stop_codon:yes gene_type:complete
MGFLLNDVIVLSKNAEFLVNRDHFYSLGNPTSHVNSRDLKFVLSKYNLKKFNISEEYLNKVMLSDLRKSKENKIISFEYFTKLLNFKKFSSIDIDPKEKPSFCIDVTKKNINDDFISKADMIYDTGSLGYTNDPIAGLNFLNSLLKVNGIIVHQSSHNGFIKTGYFQFNISFFIDYYKKNNLEIIYSSYGFFSNWLKKIIMGKWKIDIEENPNLNRIKKEKNSLYFVAKKKDN